MNNSDKIDFVIIWVDGGDEKWRREKEKYQCKKIVWLMTEKNDIEIGII